MSNNSNDGFLLAFYIVIIILLASPWVVNAFKFASCDFESDWKCEVIHGGGVFVPPASWITVWFDSDGD